jgi:hypothetical protein
MDISETLAPRSDQQNFDDYIAGPRTVTVTSGKVTGNPEQPVSIELAEYPGRPYKPNKSMRRVLASAWGTETDAYIGRRITLVGNPNIKYGGKAVGGIEIAAMSHLDKPLTLALTETRGKKRSFTVQPLAEAPKRDFLAEAELANGDVDALKALYAAAQQAGEPTETLEAIRAKAVS